jgi:hypothetical protein
MRTLIIAAVILVTACSGARQSEPVVHRMTGTPQPPGDDVATATVEPGEPVRLPQVREFRGIYAAGFEQESFQPCGSRERWWVINPDSLRAAYNRAGAGAYQPVYAVVRGDTTRAGYYGHLGTYRRYLQVFEVVLVAAPDTADGGRARCP